MVNCTWHYYQQSWFSTD